MSDATLRELERLAPNSPQDKAAWLRERLRSGEVCRECQGHGAAGIEWRDTTELEAQFGRPAAQGVTGGSRWGYQHIAEHPSDDPHQRVIQSLKGHKEAGLFVRDCPCAGLTLQQRIELAAYCGDEAARAVTGNCTGYDGAYHQDCCYYVVPLAALAKGLSRWGKLVQVRAAWAAGMACVKTCLHGEEDPLRCSACVAAIRALNAAKAWLDCPCEGHSSYERAVEQRTYDDARGEWSIPFWATSPVRATWSTNAGDAYEVGIKSAARYLDERTVCKAICEELTRWALGGPEEKTS